MARKKKAAPQDIELVLASLQKEFGAGAIFQLGGTTLPDIEKTSSGSLLLDRALGGGYPVGRIVEIYGPESSGKTTLMLHAIKAVQDLGRLAAFVDAEHALDIIYAERLGVDVKKLIISQPSCGEEALQMVDHLARTGQVGMIVVDSVASLIPKAELEGEIGDNHVGRQSRLMSQALRTLAGVANTTKTTIAFTNQIRMKIGVMFGNPETTSGGNALKFYASQRLDIRRRAANKSTTSGDVESITSRVKVVKNKVAPPFREAEITINFGTGIDILNEVVDLALDSDLVQKSGAWYTFQDQRYHGLASLAAYFRENIPVFEELLEKVR